MFLNSILSDCISFKISVLILTLTFVELGILLPAIRCNVLFSLSKDHSSEASKLFISPTIYGS